MNFSKELSRYKYQSSYRIKEKKRIIALDSNNM